VTSRSALILILPLASLVTVLLTGCGAPAVYRSPSYSYTPIPQPAYNPGDATHTFSVKVVDSSAKPVKGAKVEWKTEANNHQQTQTTVTDESGESTITVTVQPKISPTIKWADYSSTASYVASMEGYYSKHGRFTQTSYRSVSSSREARPSTETAILILPTDYLAADFSQAKQYAQLRQKVLEFFNLIRLESILNQSDLKLHGVRMQEFKGKRYLTFELNSDNVFNSLKLDRYAIGKAVFDETVRKTLNPLNNKISDPKLFYGYNIIVNTKMKNFSKEYDLGDKLKYEFMMPQTAVHSYKNKDISGQKLIDESIVILNDERIDLKFQ
jgi:hypothetical protein